MPDRIRPANPRDELLHSLNSEFEQNQSQSRELKALVEQTENEIDRLQQKNALVTNRIHQVESNFDSVPRQDIKIAFNEAMDTQRRLLTMRGNLEKLQSNRQHLEHSSKLLSQIIQQIDGLSPAAFNPEGVSEAEASPAAATIIRVIEAQEAERQRLARQMHDGPAQSLTNFILQAEICQRLFDRNPDRAAEELTNLKTVASGTFQKVRDFIFDLRPMMLDDLGLVPTLRRYVESYIQKSGLKISFHLLGEDRRLESHREVILFRCIQELLNNARDHARPSQIIVTLDMGNEFITATVEDNGRGFKADAVMAETDQTSSNTAGLGLKTMRERLELIGGGVEVQSEEGKGSKITVRLPAGGVLRDQ